MTNRQNPEIALNQAQSDRMDLSIETLRALLYRFIPLLNSESAETKTRSTLALEKMHGEIRHILARQHILNSQDRLERWENEGGRIAYDSEQP